MPKEVLITIAQDLSYNTTDDVVKLEGLMRKERLVSYYDTEFVQSFIDKKRRQGTDFAFSWYPRNVPGEWMGQNIQSPNQVIPEPITVQRVTHELERSEVSYIVAATYLSGYSTVRDISEYVHNNHPGVQIVVASVGALVPESQQFADHIVKGDQVSDLRRILGEQEEAPLKVVTVRSDTQTTFQGHTKRASYGLLVSSLGCMYGCDFCPSTAQFGICYSAPFSAEQIKEAIIQSYNQVAPGSDDFTISIAEPQGMGNTKLWKRVFELCRDLPFQCNLVSTTSSKVLERFTLDELTGGNLKLGTVNIGVESLLRGYKKNEEEELKKLNDRLQEVGINVVSTFIIGLDWQDPKNIWEEIALLKALESSGYIVANLEMQPGTPLYNQYKKEGRLLDVPPELLAFYGYQAFRHPHFRSGFNDMLPLLDEIGEELSGGNSTLARNLTVFLNRKSSRIQDIQEEIRLRIEAFRQSLDINSYSDGGTKAIQNFAAEQYFNSGFRQIDLFHPFILSTN